MGGVRPGMRDNQGADGDRRPRLFVAVLLPPAWLDALAAAQEELRRDGLRLRYVRPESIHVTLMFLGETPAARIGDLSAALAAAAAESPVCMLTLAAAGTFGSRRRPRVVWYGLAGELTALGSLQRHVEERLARVGFAPEGREFRPHLTLARVPDDLSPAEAERIAPAIERLRVPQPPPFRVEAIALMQSRLGPGGARYTMRENWPLSEAAGT